MTDDRLHEALDALKNGAWTQAGVTI